MNRYLERRSERDMHFKRAKEFEKRMHSGYRGEIGQEYYPENPGIDPRYKDNDRVDYRDYRRDYNDYNDYNRQSYQYPPMNTDRRDYEDHRRGGYRDRRDYGDYRDYRDYRGYDMDYRDYRDYDMDYDMAKGHDEEKKYHEHLKKYIEELKSKDRFHIRMEDLIEQAKQMGVKFDDFTEEEFYAAYLMVMNEYKNVANDHRMYLGMAKSFLESPTTKSKGSEKMCAYLYEIVNGGEMK